MPRAELGVKRSPVQIRPARLGLTCGFSQTADFDPPHRPGRRASLPEGVGDDGLFEERHRTTAASRSGSWKRGGASTQVLIARSRKPGRRLWSRRGSSVRGGAARGAQRAWQGNVARTQVCWAESDVIVQAGEGQQHNSAMRRPTPASVSTAARIEEPSDIPATRGLLVYHQDLSGG